MIPWLPVIALLIKVTLLFAGALLAVRALSGSTAAVRQAVCVCAFAVSLLLPFGLWMPSAGLRIRVAATSWTGAGAASQGASFSPELLRDLLSDVWLFGTLLLAARLVLGYFAAARVEDVPVPMATGLLRPQVRMPRGSESWPEWQRTAALRHELAHLSRGDLWWNLLGQVACAVYWFHPLTWYLRRLMEREQEAACDDAVLASGFSPANYAEALLVTARPWSLTSNLQGCPMIQSTNLKPRIARLLDSSLVRSTSRSALRRTALVFAGLLLTLGLVNAEDVYKVGGGVSAPKLERKVDPVYDAAAKDEKISGAVLLSLIVGSDGLPHDITVEQSLDPRLDEKAIEAVKQWVFAPGTRNGEPVAVRATIEINFRLQ